MVSRYQKCKLLLLLQPFYGLFSRTTWVSRYQKGKTNLDITGARDSEWQWHQLGHMQVCTSLQTDNHATTQFFTGRMPFLPPNQQCQSTEVLCYNNSSNNSNRNASIVRYICFVSLGLLDKVALSPVHCCCTICLTSPSKFYFSTLLN